MARVLSKKDYVITATIGGVPRGEFDQAEGFDTEWDNGEYVGMGKPAQATHGTKKRSTGTLKRREDDPLNDRAGWESALVGPEIAVTIHHRDSDGNPGKLYGRYSGIMGKLAGLETDPSSGDASMITIEVSADA